MKVRSGFVSNSSSSSFVLVGYKASDIDFSKLLGDDEELCDWAEERGLDCPYLEDDGSRLLGKYIAHWDDYEVSSVPVSQFLSYLEEMKKQVSDLGIEEEPRIYSGTRYC